MNAISDSRCKSCTLIVKSSDPFPFHITEGNPVGTQVQSAVICVSCFKIMFEPAFVECGIDLDNLDPAKCSVCNNEIIYDDARIDTYPRFMKIEQRMEEKEWILGMHTECAKKFKKAMRDAARSAKSASDCTVESSPQSSASTVLTEPE